MSQSPPSPLGYSEPFIPTPPRRPTSVTVLAIIGIIFGALGLLCTPFSLLPFFVDFGQPNPVIDGIKFNNFLFFWTIGASVMGVLLAIVLLAGSIGSLKLSPWARQVMLAYAALSIVIGLVGAGIHITMIMPMALEQARNLPAGPARNAATGGAYGGIIGAGIGLLYPVFVLAFYNKANVISAFNTPAPPGV